MAVEWTRQKSSREYGDDEKAELKGQRVYLVKCNALADDPDIALASCPAIGTAWSAGKPGLIVRSRKANETSRGEDFVLYEISLEYSTKSADGKDPAQAEEDPLDRPPEVSLDFEAYDETVYQAEDVPTGIDADGNTVTLDWSHGKNICASSGEQFEEQPKRTFYDPVVSIVRNEPGLAWTTAIDYAGAVNDDQFTITYRGNTYTIEIGQAKLIPPTTQSAYENGVAFERVTYKIALRKDGWKTNVKDQGLKARYNGDWPARAIKDENGDPIKIPVLLDGSGNKKGNNTAVFLRFPLFSKKTFGGLNLDQSWNEANP